VIVPRAAFADADAVERPNDCERQPVLLLGPFREVLGGELLKAVGRRRRRAAVLGAFGGREFGRVLEDHRR